MTRVRRPAAEWAALIDAWQRSGLSLPAFCTRRGLNAKTMQGWVYKRTHRGALERAQRDAGAAEDPPRATEFLPVRIVDAEREHVGASRSGVAILLGVGRRIAVEAGFDSETLRRVVAVLEERPC
jgi:hypothetical protein